TPHLGSLLDFRLWTVDFGLCPFYRQGLVNNFFGCQVAFEAGQTTGAEFAAIGAADLRRDTKCVPIARFAVESRAGGNENALDQRMVGQSPKELLRRVARALFPNQFEGMQRIMAP